MEKKTGGHIRPCNVGSVEAHNERSEKYLEGIKKAGLKIYFFTELSHHNSSWVNDKDRYKGKTCSEIFEDMKNKYINKHGQVPQLRDKKRVDKKTGKIKTIAGWSPLREMVVPIKSNTANKDFDFFKKWMKNEGVDVVRIDIHKDEGHRDDMGKIIVNNHAHVVLSFFDWETATTVKLGRDKMSEMQTVLATSLDMQRGEKKEDTGREYLKHQDYKALMQEVGATTKKLNSLKDDEKKAETRVKGLSTMLLNLQEQYNNLKKQYDEMTEQWDVDSAAFKWEMERNTIEANQLKEKNEAMRKQMDELHAKIEERQEQLQKAKQQLQDLQQKTDQEKELIKGMYTEKDRQEKNLKDRQKEYNALLKDMQQDLQQKKEAIEAEDKDGLVEKYREQASYYRDFIFSRWPGCREAVDSIVQRTLTPTAKKFTLSQVVTIENAISLSVSGKDIDKREKLCEDLMDLACQSMINRDGRPANSKWIEQTAKEVTQIAQHNHPLSFMIKLNKDKSTNGGPSYITDMTDWAGNPITR